MNFSIDELILDSKKRAAVSQISWNQKHIPIMIGDQLTWLTIEVPAVIQATLDVLPKERDSAVVKRPHQIKTRLSNKELEAFHALVLASGLSQADYIRGMVLHGRVDVTQTSLVDSQALDVLNKLSADLGKTAGMIRQTVIVNKEFAVLTPESKDELEYQLRKLRQLQTYIQRLAEEIHGHL